MIFRVFFACVLGLLCAFAWAGQMGSHIYSAQLARQYLSGSARRAVEANPDLYFSGAQGPDICGVIMPKMNTASFFDAIGEETHYSDRKAGLALNLLDCATTDSERAYALGWISHYINDIFVHALVNEYGGYYKLYGEHHKELEMLEQKHVLSAHGDVVTPRLCTTTPTTRGVATFANFIFDAYHKTYPDNKIYQSGNEWFVENKPYFARRYAEASNVCRIANEAFLNSHTNTTGNHGWAIGGNQIFPPMPSSEAYKKLQNAVEITAVEPSADRIRVTLQVNDTKLYGRFLVDWEQAMVDATRYSNQVFTLASAYLDEKVPARKAELRAQLLAVIPNENLDQPSAIFTPEKANPGNQDIRQVPYFVTLYPQAQPGAALPKPVIIQGRSPLVVLKEKHFAGSQAGAVSFDVTVPANAVPYRFTLQAALSGKAALQNPEYRTVDWVEAQGQFPGAWMAGAGGVKVTDYFTVRVPLPANRDKTKGARRWVAMAPGHALAAEDVSLIRSSTPCPHFRYDVRVLEEKFEGNTLVATLQVTNTNPALQTVKGNAKLLMVWFDQGKAETTTTEELDLLGKDLDKAMAAMEEVEKILDELLTDEQEEKLGQIIEKYEAELTKQGKSEADIEKLLAQRALVEMEKMGVDMSAFKKLNDIERTMNDSMALPFHVTSDIALQPVELAMDVNGAWKRQSPTSANSTAERKDGKGRRMWTREAGCSAFMGDDMTEVDAFTKRQAGKTGVMMTINGFTGTVYEATAMKSREGAADEYHTALEGYLVKGKVYLHVTAYASAVGYRIYETGEDKKVHLVYDGAADAKKERDTAFQQALDSLRGARLQPAR